MTVKDKPEWHEGKAAYQRGVAYTSCPYRRRSQKAMVWRQGHADAKVDEESIIE